MMDRRKFLSTLIGGVAASAAVRTFPFRVFSFPREIQYPALFGGEPGDLSKTVGPIGVNIYRNLIGGKPVFIESLSLSAAMARYGYEWRPGYSKTQQAKNKPHFYLAPLGGPTTGLIDE